MKCPKCGYHSFDYLDSCKKCGNDLTSFKRKFNLRSLIFPHLPTQAAISPAPESADLDILSPIPPAAATAPTDFGFDFMDESSTSPPPVPPKVVPPKLGGAAQTTAAPLPLEDDTFSWDEEPQATAPTPAADSVPVEDFDWAEETPQGTATDEEDGNFEESEKDDTFGLDLSWDADLPALDESQLEEEEPLEPMATDDLPDWNFEEEPPIEINKTPKAKEQEGPRNPFELRGPGEEILTPVTADLTETIREELPFGPETEAAPVMGTAVAGSAETIVPASDIAAEAPRAKGQEDLLTALAATPAVDSVAEPTTPSPITRTLALIIDLMVLAVAILLFLVAGEAALAPEESQSLLPSREVLVNLAIPYFLVLFSVCFGYFTLFHFLIGQTPGKMFLRLRVETESGTPLAFSQAFLRSTGGLFSLLLLGLGFLAILFDRRRRGWNDRLAGTLVVAATAVAEIPDKTKTDLP